MPKNALRDTANHFKKECFFSFQQVSTPCMDRLGDGGQHCETHDDDNAEELTEDKEYMNANANRVPMGPSPTVTAGCTCGRTPWEPNTMRSVVKDGRPRNFANHKGWATGKGSGAHVSGPRRSVRFVGERRTRACHPFRTSKYN